MRAIWLSGRPGRLPARDASHGPDSMGDAMGRQDGGPGTCQHALAGILPLRDGACLPNTFRGDHGMGDRRRAGRREEEIGLRRRYGRWAA